jgi:hypothetical protein
VAARSGLNLALAYTVPSLLWLLGQSVVSRVAHVDIALSLQSLLPTLLLLQACMLALCLPWLMRFSTHRARLSTMMMLLFVPLPVYAVSWLTGATIASVLMLSMLGLIGLGVLLYALYWACLALTPPGQVRAAILLTVQLVLIGLCWSYRGLWQEVLGW